MLVSRIKLYPCFWVNNCGLGNLEDLSARCLGQYQHHFREQELNNPTSALFSLPSLHLVKP